MQNLQPLKRQDFAVSNFSQRTLSDFAKFSKLSEEEIMKEKNQIKKMKNKISKLFLMGIILVFAIINVSYVSAHCPLCTGATIAGVGLTRAWGLDDSIVGVFVGGMIISTALWLENISQKRINKGNKRLRIVSYIVLVSVLTLVSFYYAGLFGLGNTYRIFGIERILFGTISGGVVSLGIFYLSIYLKDKNNGKTLFSYQTMVLSLAALIFNAVLFGVIF